ncbi:MAG: ABC transporter permease, partial [Methanoregulaceae archaeon]|nr:ABC transporter permease [Methanoregulaceae archaeon]
MDSLAMVGGVWQAYDLGLRTVQHLEMFAISFFITVTAGILLGIVFFSSINARVAGITVLTIIEMIPDIALLILLIPVVGIGVPPTVSAAVLYSLLPVARNTTAGLGGASPHYVETARAVGLTERETLYRIRFPLALPLIFAGVRIAVIFCMGVVTLGGLIGAGGLGAPLQTGITTGTDLLILGAGVWGPRSRPWRERCLTVAPMTSVSGREPSLQGKTAT